MKKTFDSVELMRSIRAEMDKEIEEEGLKKWVQEAKDKIRKIKLWKKLSNREPSNKQIKT